MSDDASDTFECYGVVLPPDGVTVKIKELAEFLGYENVKMARSNKPMAKQRMKFVYETILPTIRKTRRFDIKKNNINSVEPYDIDVANMKIKLLEQRLEHQAVVAKYDSQVADLNTSMSCYRGIFGLL
ncbi:Bro19 [Heliothis virescens ascovirus 3g]|uniref:Bro19 n=1 Tax=Heliothis virescens ascovirus 3g TaxID=1246651 RepID=K4NYF5_9VIRU|nr:Bro19 [Heliothis virescens ascovirus 3g]AFV50392.1 Bro19 [Heliothis virescens ascovirus 3g]